MALRCFSLAVVVVGIAGHSCHNRSAAASKVMPCSNVVGTWQWLGYAPCVREAETSGSWDAETQTMVVIDRGADIESISSMWCPGGPCGRNVVDQCLSTKRGKRRLVEVKRAVEFVVG